MAADYGFLAFAKAFAQTVAFLAGIVVLLVVSWFGVVVLVRWAVGL